MLSFCEFLDVVFQQRVFQKRALRMSSPITKSVKRLGTRSASRHSSATSSTRKRVLAGKSTRLKPATKRSPAGKARARKAAKIGAAQQKTKRRVGVARAKPT